MRLYICTTPNQTTVPFNYQHLLLGVIHKWFGPNTLHNALSLYSFSWLKGARAIQAGLEFPSGAEWFISIYDATLAEQCMNGLKRFPEIFHGMAVRQVQLFPPPEITDSRRVFFCASPILVKVRINDRDEYLRWDDPRCPEKLTQVLTKKLQVAQVSAAATVRFDTAYPKAKTKLVTIHGIHNRVNLCPVILEGDPAALRFAWEVGIGQSTGSGFGAID